MIQVDGEGVLEIVGSRRTPATTSSRAIPSGCGLHLHLGPARALPMVFELRTRGDPMAYADSLRRVVREINPAVNVLSVRTQTASIDRTINQEIVFARLGNAFALWLY